jgi:hypothetical protein
MITYILLANNKRFKKSIIFKKNTEIVLFNNSIYLSKIEHENITIVSRIRTLFLTKENPDDEIYAGLNSIKTFQKNWNKVCFYHSPKYLPKNLKEIWDKKFADIKISDNKILEIDKDVANLKQAISYPRYKNMSTGLIYYNYLQRTDPGCKIILAGFTSEINKNYHHASWERVFFQKQQDSGKCEIIW